MRALACPASLKGVLSPVEAAAALAAGVRRVDGAGGATSCRSPTAARGRPRCSRGTLGGEWRTAPVVRPARPAGRRRAGSSLPDGTAVVESAEAIGLGAARAERARPARRVERRARRAARSRCSRPGRRRCSSASAARRPSTAARACVASCRRWPERVPLRVACDVRNPLLGERGAARVFGPQKGAGPEAVEELERAARRDGRARAVPRPAGRGRRRRARRGARGARRRARRGRRARARPDRLRRARARRRVRRHRRGHGRRDDARGQGARRGASRRCARLGVRCVLFGGRVAAHVGLEARALSGDPSARARTSSRSARSSRGRALRTELGDAAAVRLRPRRSCRPVAGMTRAVSSTSDCHDCGAPARATAPARPGRRPYFANAADRVPRARRSAAPRGRPRSPGSCTCGPRRWVDLASRAPRPRRPTVRCPCGRGALARPPRAAPRRRSCSAGARR